MTRKLLAGWVMLSLGVGALAVRADDAKPPTPGKPPTPARPETPGRPGRGAANFDALARLTSSVNDLQLTGDKKTKADEILARAKTDVDKAQKEGGDRQTMIGIVRTATEEITALLDEDQKLMFENKLKAAANAPDQRGPGAGQGPGAGGGPGGNRPLPIGQRLNEVVSTLGLSDDQKRKVDDLLTDLQKKAAEIRSAGNPGPEMRDKMQALRDDVLKQIKSMLNEEQLKKFEEAIRPQPGGGGGGGARLGAMIQRLSEGMKDLNLSDDQKTKVQSALADARKKFQELAPQLQGGQPTPELRDKIRGVLEGLRDDLSGVLNDEQKEKFRALMQGGPGAGGQGARRPNTKGEKPADK